MEEEWRDVVGYEGLYQVSSTGRIKSLRFRHIQREKNLSVQNNGTGYLKIGLSHNGETRQYLIHRLVANAFIANPNGYEFVNHKDENKKNNCVENLEWCTKSYNSIYYLNKDPSRKTEYGQRFRNKETGELLSSHTKKNVVHTNTEKIVQKSVSGDVICVYENSICASLETGIPFSAITKTCRANACEKPRYGKKRRTKEKYTSRGYVWEFFK